MTQFTIRTYSSEQNLKLHCKLFMTLALISDMIHGWCVVHSLHCHCKSTQKWFNALFLQHMKDEAIGNSNISLWKFTLQNVSFQYLLCQKVIFLFFMFFMFINVAKWDFISNFKTMCLTWNSIKCKNCQNWWIAFQSCIKHQQHQIVFCVNNVVSHIV